MVTKIVVPFAVFLLVIASSLGVRVKFSINTKTLSAQADFIFFGLFKIVKVQAFYWNEAFFVRINKKGIKKLAKKRTQQSWFAKRLNWKKPPKMRLGRVTVNINVNSGDNALTPMLTTVAMQNIMGNINALIGKYIEIKKPRVTIFPAYGAEGSKIYISFRPGFNQFAIFFYVLRTLTAAVWKRKSKA